MADTHHPRITRRALDREDRLTGSEPSDPHRRLPVPIPEKLLNGLEIVVWFGPLIVAASHCLDVYR
jgi:hypothetical protein